MGKPGGILTEASKRLKLKDRGWGDPTKPIGVGKKGELGRRGAGKGCRVFLPPLPHKGGVSGGDRKGKGRGGLQKNPWVGEKRRESRGALSGWELRSPVRANQVDWEETPRGGK